MSDLTNNRKKLLNKLTNNRKKLLNKYKKFIKCLI